MGSMTCYGLFHIVFGCHDQPPSIAFLNIALTHAHALNSVTPARALTCPKFPTAFRAGLMVQLYHPPHRLALQLNGNACFALLALEQARNQNQKTACSECWSRYVDCNRASTRRVNVYVLLQPHACTLYTWVIVG